MELKKFRMIIEQVEDKNPKVNLDHTPLHFAAKRGNIEICKLILEHVTRRCDYATAIPTRSCEITREL